jgi:integrase
MLSKAKKLIKAGVNPIVHKKALHDAKIAENPGYFEAVAKEWFDGYKAGKKESYSSRIWAVVKNDLLPFLGERPIEDIKAPELLEALRKIEDRGAFDTAHRCLHHAGQIFRHAIAAGRISHDITEDLKGALSPVITHDDTASLEDAEDVGALLKATDEYNGNAIVKAALQMAPYVFVRPDELRHAEWSEIDLENAEWRIPAEKMKTGQTHIVPLSAQVVDILQGIKPETGSGRYLFPSATNDGKPISSVTLTAALKKLGYARDEMTVYGFRPFASTMLNVHGFSGDLIERQLARVGKNPAKDTYNYAEFLPERRKMMQFWADFLAKLKRIDRII